MNGFSGGGGGQFFAYLNGPLKPETSSSWSSTREGRGTRSGYPCGAGPYMLELMSDYKVKATDSAGTQFQLGAAAEALKVVAFIQSAERAKLPVSDIIVEAPDGSEIDRAELKRRAQEEVHAIALKRAGRTYLPGRPPGA